MDPTPASHVSTFYNLGRSQEALDFVDVNLLGDAPVFQFLPARFNRLID